MASLSPQGERTVLALLAEQYDEIIELRIALAQAQEQLADRTQPQPGEPSS